MGSIGPFFAGAAEAKLMKDAGAIPTRPHPRHAEIVQYQLSEEIHRKTFSIAPRPHNRVAAIGVLEAKACVFETEVSSHHYCRFGVGT